MKAILSVQDLHVSYLEGRFPVRRPKAIVRGVSFDVAPGEIVGLIGESGSGKSTIARAIVGLAPIISGLIEIAGNNPSARNVQMIFQDPFSSLDPRMSVGRQIAEVFCIRKVGPRSEWRDRTIALLKRVGLPDSAYDRLPRAFSGGQRARIGIARALAAEPRLLIADEATAALDVSVQAQVLNLLMDLRDDLGLSLLFITHDLAVVDVLCDRALVLQQGRVVEEGPVTQLFTAPQHDYTRMLFAAHV